MKKVFPLLLILIVSAQIATSQGFAPAGAIWYYNEISTISPDISFTYFVALKDTVYEGVPCRTIGGNGNDCSWSPYLVYDQNDSVFFWHPQRNEFCLLYDFGAQTGESWTVHNITSGFGNEDEDSTIVYVDSTGMTTIDGEDLRVVYTSVLNQGETQWQFNGPFIERLGGLHLFPVFEFCDPVPGELRCYDDTVISFHQGPFDCDEVISSVAENTKNVDLWMYPNPSNGFVNIDFGTDLPPPVAIRLVSTKGEPIIIKDFKVNSRTILVNLSDLSAGTYLVEVYFSNATYQSKIILKP